MNARLVAAIAFGICAVALLWTWIGVERPGSAGPERHSLLPARGSSSTPPGAVDGSTRAVSASVQTSAVPDAPPPTTSPGLERVGSIGANLAAFYGAAWPELRSELAQRVDLDVAPDVPLPEWDRVLDELREKMRVRDAIVDRWRHRYAPPDPVSVEYLVEKFLPTDLAVDSRDVRAIESVLVEGRAEVQQRLEDLRVVCDGILVQKFASGQYDRAPYSNIRAEHVSPRAFYRDFAAIRGWVVTWGIEEGEDPELSVLLADLERLRERMVREIEQYLAGLK